MCLWDAQEQVYDDKDGMRMLHENDIAFIVLALVILYNLSVAKYEGDEFTPPADDEAEE